MRTFARATAVLMALAAGILVATTPAHAAAGAVLTTGSLGGPAVAVGDTVTSGLKSGVTARFFTTAGGTTGVTCSVSQFTGTIQTNPAAGGTATENLTAQTFSSCTSNISGVTAVQSVTVNNLPYSASLDAATSTISVTSAAATPIQATVRLTTVLGTVSCQYRAVGNAFSGAASNADNSLTFTSQQFSKSSGPFVCPGNSFFSATYAPAVDTSVAGSPAVFLN